MAVQISGNDITVPRDGSFTRNVTIGGTLTYEDVTNIDSVGLVTARTGIEIGARPGVAASISVDGNMVVSGISTVGELISSYGTFVRNVNDNGLTIAGGTASNSGANVTVYGGSHGSYPDTVRFRIDGSEKARIDSSGRVLIGTTTEGYSSADDLTVSTSGATGISIRSGTSNTGTLAFSDGTSGADEYRGYIQYQHQNNALAFGSNGTERLRIDSSGRMLVGSNTSVAGDSTYQFSFQVSGTSYVTSTINNQRYANDINGASYIFSKSRGTSIGAHAVLQNNDQIGKIRFYGSDGTDFGCYGAEIAAHVDGSPGSNDMPGRLVFKTTADGAETPTERVRITKDGYLGLGAGSNTNKPLHIYTGSSDAEIRLQTNSGTEQNSYITLRQSNGDLDFYTVQSGTSMKFHTENTERVRITSGGSLLIGATSTNYDELFTILEGGTDNEIATWRVNNASHNKDMMNMIHVAGSGSRVMIRFRRTGSLSSIGDITTSTTATSYGTNSDYRLKENEVLISDGITRLKALKPYRFNFKAEPDKTVDGFFAHEVQALVPEAVTGEKDAVETTYYTEGDTIPDGKVVGDVKEENAIDPQGLDYAKLTPLLTAALQEAVTEIESLKARLDAAGL